MLLRLYPLSFLKTISELSVTMSILYKSKNLGSLEFEIKYIPSSSFVQPTNDAFVFSPGVMSILFPSLIK